MPAAPEGNAVRKIAALVLAAGQSTRMRGRNKLLARVGEAPLIRTTVRTLLAARVRSVLVVTGHEPQRIAQALAPEPVQLVHNPAYRTGLSSSLRCGLAALPAATAGVLVCLADMPRVSALDIERLIAAFAPEEGRPICVPIFDGQRGNPVLWASRFIPEMMLITGDTGARELLLRHADLVHEVEAADAGVLLDVDTPEDLATIDRSDAR